MKSIELDLEGESNIATTNVGHPKRNLCKSRPNTFIFNIGFKLFEEFSCMELRRGAQLITSQMCVTPTFHTSQSVMQDRYNYLDKYLKPKSGILMALA